VENTVATHMEEVLATGIYIFNSSEGIKLNYVAAFPPLQM
jgi:hypothetical protein